MAQLIEEESKEPIDPQTKPEASLSDGQVKSIETKKPQLFLVRKPRPSEMQQEDSSLTEEERSSRLLEKMLQLQLLQAEKEQDMQVDELGLETIALEDDKFDKKTGLKNDPSPPEQDGFKKTKSNNFFSIDESAERI